MCVCVCVLPVPSRLLSWVDSVPLPERFRIVTDGQDVCANTDLLPFFARADGCQTDVRTEQRPGTIMMGAKIAV